MKKFFCVGTHEGSDVTANITDLSEFINAAPTDLIFVDDGNAQFQVKKGEVQWREIQKVDPVL